MKGDLRTLIRVSLPLFLFLFCEGLAFLGEKAFLSRYYGVSAVSGTLNGGYLAFIFQSSCAAVASMALVFIGLYQGKGELKEIGPCVWQLIWFSFLSLIITLPLGLLSARLYFKGTVVEEIGLSYFNVLSWGNFLFPLNTALTSFYIGRGKTTLVSLLMLASYCLNLLLCWLLIFGIKDSIPPLGIRGAALAKCLSLGVVCVVFFTLFLSKTNREIYGTGIWGLSLKRLWVYMRPGMMRVFQCFWVRGSWAAISYLMISKGGSYLDVQAIGGMVIFFLAFIVVGIQRAILAISPNLLGGKHYDEIRHLFRSLSIYVGIIGVILTVPLFLYPQAFTLFFDASSREVFDRVFGQINHWIWLHIVALSVQMGLCGFIVAIQDLKTQFYSFILITIVSFFTVYLAMDVWSCSPDKLWLIMGLENVLLALVFFWRIYLRKWEEQELSDLQTAYSK